MSLFNQINLVGNVAKDPLINEGEKGWAVIRLASNTGKKDSGEVLFIDVKLFSGAFRDLQSFYIKKGDRVSVSGTLKANNYEDKNGVKHSGCVIYADYVLKIANKEVSEASPEETVEEGTSPF